ncbi:MAG: site-specific integrase [Planctomycetales bacterium]|nr:site-specific integrase [Planctomycetales bacterium]
MASLNRSPYGVYQITFRYQGKRYHRSLGTKSEAQAMRKKGVIETALEQLDTGTLAAPTNVTASQLFRFLQAGGRGAAPKPTVTDRVTLAVVSSEYLASYSLTAKEQSTLETEAQHLRHIERIIGAETSMSEISPAMLREYVRTRESEPGTHGRTVSAVTISKELATFRQLFEFATNEKLVDGENPLTHVRKPRPAQKPRFMTRSEIESAIARGGLTESDVAMFWECLFLSESEVGEFLTHVQRTATTFPRFFYIYPAIAFCAYTGCRRSEMFRAQVSDVDGSTIQIREKKRSQRETFTFRQVPIHSDLRRVLDDWLGAHPGGQTLFPKANLRPLDDRTSREAFRAVTKQSRWSVLRGYHILRHSFASNLARHGVDQRTIDSFLGHQTEASRQRYRHLFPADSQAAVDILDYTCVLVL